MYGDTSGPHETELTHEGQRIQYVPPGGGVATVTVLSVTGSATETGYVVDYSFEGSSNGYLTQKYQRLVLTGRLRGSQLDVSYSEAGISSFGDKTGLTATEGATEYRRLTQQADIAVRSGKGWGGQPPFQPGPAAVSSGHTPLTTWKGTPCEGHY